MLDNKPIAVHMYEPMRLTREVVGAPVTTRNGVVVGRVYDVYIRGSKVIGIMVGPEAVHFHDVINVMKAHKTIPHIIRKARRIDHKKFISWKDVRKIKNCTFVLERDNKKKVRYSKPKGISLIKRVLDEQVADKANRYIGRVDEVQLVYVYGERNLEVVGFYSGASAMLTRIGLKTSVKNMSRVFKIKFGEDIIPWNLVKKISKEPPTRVILKIRVK